MKISAVICELNPLHLGHRRLLDFAREQSDGVVCILSGNFVQRGETAILDKWARCRLTLENGADLVLELPLPWACAGAERFALGGVSLAAALGAVDLLIFGSEEGDIQRLEQAANALLSREFSQLLGQMESSGETFARRRELALGRLIGPEHAAVLRRPNAVLAIEYIKAIKRENAPIVPVPMLREGAGHDEKASGGQLRSAGELRELLLKGEDISGFVPENTAVLLRELTARRRCPARLAFLERAILCKLRAMPIEAFTALPDISEGLENRLYQAARQAGSLEELYALAKSKRYTHARIRRLAMAAFLDLTADLPARPPYLRVLGMTKAGERILKEASPTLPITARPADFQRLGGDALRLFQLEAQADDLYGLAFEEPVPCGREYWEKLVKL